MMNKILMKDKKKKINYNKNNIQIKNIKMLNIFLIKVNNTHMVINNKMMKKKQIWSNPLSNQDNLLKQNKKQLHLKIEEEILFLISVVYNQQQKNKIRMKKNLMVLLDHHQKVIANIFFLNNNLMKTISHLILYKDKHRRLNHI